MNCMFPDETPLAPMARVLPGINCPLRLTILISLVLLSFLPRSLSGQTPWPPEIGERIQVELFRSGGPLIDGRLSAVSGHRITVSDLDSGVLLNLATGDIHELLVHRGFERQAEKGLAWGVGLGAGVGLGCGAFFWYRTILRDEPVSEVLLVTGSTGAILGGIIGLGYGHFTKRDRWAPVALPDVDFDLRMEPGGRIGLVVSLPVGR